MKKGLLISSVLCFVLGAALFALPGVRFSAYLLLCMGGACLLLCFLDIVSEKSGFFRWCKRIFLVGLAALILLVAVLEAVILSYGEEDHSTLRVDAVIVLGAGVNGETPSAALRSRIDAAAEYIYGSCPDGIPVVLSGGQGSGEDISEAEAMYRALIGHSLRPTDIPVNFILEDRSTSTAENFAYSKTLLENLGLDTESAVIAVVTNDFHCYRARLIAQREGLSTIGIPAELPWWWLTANYYLRDAFALVKTVLFD